MKIIPKIKNHLRLTSPSYNRVIRFFRRAEILKYTTEFEIRQNISLFDFMGVSSEIPIPCNTLSLMVENSLYGNDNALKIVLKDLPKNSYSIEHGFIFGSLVQKFHIGCWGDTIVTHSDYRRDMIRAKSAKKILCVGPFINYAYPLLGEKDFSDFKSELGKCLLIFPCHSTADEEVSFETDNFCDYIDSKKANFDNVLVCLYWKDVQLGQASKYLKRGYKVTSAGHIYDKYFLSRLKTIINASDLVIANDIGTHISYCTFLKKPLLLFNQLIKYDLKTSNYDEVTQFDVTDTLSYEDISKRLFDIFSEENLQFDLKIGDEKFLEYLFGFSKVLKING